MTNLLREGRVAIQDEQGKFVSATAIKLIGNEVYTYCNYQVQVTYNLQNAEKALLQLQMANKYAKMNHTFTLIGGEEKKLYSIVDNNGNYVDCSAIFPMPVEGSKDMQWYYWSYTTPCSSGLLRYYSESHCNRIMEGLEILRDYAGFSNIKFHVVEVTKENLDPAEDIIEKIPMAKGTKTKALKFRNQILKQYMC